MHASLFSSVKHKTQGFDGDGSSIGCCKVVSIVAVAGFFAGGSAFVDDTVSDSIDDVDISASVILEESTMVDELTACSRIFFIATFGVIIFSFFPSIYSICFCKTIAATRRSQSSRKSSPNIEEECLLFNTIKEKGVHTYV
jgi:hypothetical protein